MTARERSFWAATVLTLFVIVGVMQQAKAGAQLSLGFYQDSLAATRDTTRILTVSQHILGANLQAFQRRALQQEQRGDSLDHALKLERKGKAELTLSFESVKALNATAARVMADSADSVRHAAWLFVDQGPIDTIGIVVHMPRPPTPALIDLGVKFKPVPLGFRIHCGDANPNGVRSADLTVLSPKWLHVNVGAAEWDPYVCNPPATARPWWKHWQPYALAGVAYLAGR